jgi:vitamin K-dependent gamma-carboxylase
MLGRLRALLFSPVDIAPLVAWRILFGLLLVIEGFGAILTGWVHEAYVAPSFHFHYFGFEWVRPIPGYSMVVHFSLLAALGAMVAAGLYYRIAAALLAIAWTYAFLLEKAFYQNHYYLMVLIAFWMIWVPAHRAGSLDARRRPELRTEQVSAWSIDVFRALVTLVYFYAGVAKINPDWLRLVPIQQWLSDHASLPLIGGIYASRPAAIAFAYGGLAFDLSIGLLLWWRRTRLVAFFATVLFHGLNLLTFTIGIFPLLAIAITALFLPEAWFRRALAALGILPASPEVTGEVAGRHPAILPLLVTFFAVELALPLRHHLIDSDVDWSEEGHRFSWRMMLRTKSGDALFLVRDPAARQTFRVRPEEHLHGRQVSKLPGQPDLIWQFAQHLERHYRAQGHADVEVRVIARTSLNFRPRALLIDPKVDLTSVDYQLFKANPWILPFER